MCSLDETAKVIQGSSEEYTSKVATNTIMNECYLVRKQKPIAMADLNISGLSRGKRKKKFSYHNSCCHNDTTHMDSTAKPKAAT